MAADHENGADPRILEALDQDARSHHAGGTEYDHLHADANPSQVGTTARQSRAPVILITSTIAAAIRTSC